MFHDWAEDLRLLLIYKDPLGDDRLGGSPLTSASPTLVQHLQLSKPEELPPGVSAELEAAGLPVPPTAGSQFALFPVVAGNARCQRPVPEGCAVWGWWRKPWETHQRLLARLQRACAGGVQPKLLLYNQYLRRMYHAVLRDVYYEPDLTTITVPASWAERCPAYYRDLWHLCGAFFVVDIDPHEQDANELASLFVDSSSFAEPGEPVPAVVPRPDAVEAVWSEMVDRSPSRVGLRTCEQTALVLRTYRQRDRTAAILTELEQGESDSVLARAFRETSWPDLLAVLGSASATVWKALSGCPEAVESLGVKAQLNRSRLTRFDFELVAGAFNSASMQSLLCQSTDSEGLSELGRALRTWVTSDTERGARTAAAQLFMSAWSSAEARYKVAPLPQEYFASLPAMEAIANAVKYEIGRKFYRDHLNHNVRAALLASRLMGRHVVASACLEHPAIVGFFAGLLHDVALPVTDFPDLVGGIASALSKAQAPTTRAVAPVHPILDRSELKRSLTYVALLAAMPNLPERLETAPVKPWEDQGAALAAVDTQLLVEELLCAASEEHALVSAALLFDYAVRGAASEASFDTGLRTLLTNISGPAATAQGRELACILQCMALHDRRPAAEHHGVLERPRDTPKPLDLERFRLAALTSIADEFQEWGRTIGAIDEIGAVDGHVELHEERVRAEFTLTPLPGVFAAIPFSLLEYAIGKLRTVGTIRAGSGRDAKPLNLDVRLSGLEAFELSYVAAGGNCEVVFGDPFDRLDFSKWPDHTEQSREVYGTATSEMVAIRCAAPGSHARDFLLIEGSDELRRIIRLKAAGATRLRSLDLSSDSVVLKLADGAEVSARVNDYRFGYIGDKSVPADKFTKKEKSSLLRLTVTEEAEKKSVGSSPTTDIQLYPYPHFLDFDWRFTSPTSNAVVTFVREAAAHDGASVCYLGCPSLAIAHHRRFPQDENWILLDQGHYALDQWLRESALPSQSFRPYNAFDAVPPDLAGKFGIVVTDPPWYDPQYLVFSRRVRELVKPRGIVGLSYYPPSLDRGKYERFHRLVFGGPLVEFVPFGSLEIDYAIPEYERPSEQYRRYVHPALGIYRPGFLDFFVAPAAIPQVKSRPEAYEPHRLTRRVALSGGHHLLCLPEESVRFPVSVQFSRRSIKRIKHIPGTWIGWTSRNLIVKASETPPNFVAADLAALVARIEEIETGAEQVPAEG